MIESPNRAAYNAAQSEEKARSLELLADLCAGVPQPEQTKGRPRLPLADMIFAAVYKVYVGFSWRRFTSDLKDALIEGHIDTTPHFNSVSRYLSDPQLTDVLREVITASSLPLTVSYLTNIFYSFLTLLRCFCGTLWNETCKR